MARITFYIFIVCLTADGGFSSYVPSEDSRRATIETVNYPPEDGNGTSCICQNEIPNRIACNSTVGNGGQMIAENLSSRMDQFNTTVIAQDQRITSLTQNLTSVLDKLERIEAGNLVITRPEFDSFQREIDHLENLLILLKQNSTASRDILAALEAEVRNMTGSLKDFAGRDESDTAQLLTEIQGLKKRLADCKHTDEEEELDTTFFYDWNKPGHSNPCSKLDNVSAPYTMKEWRDNHLKGTWFRDPIKDTEKVYVLPLSSYSFYQNIVNVYASMRDLQLGVMERGITLPEHAQGSGMVAYNGSLYYNVRNSRDIARYDIAEESSKKSPLPPTTNVDNRGAYLSGSHSDIDFAVDESGLWVIFATSSTGGVISISKLDPDTLLLTDTWVTSVAKSRQGNCFVICQVLHCTNGYNTHTDKINFYFDTKTSIESFTYVPIDSKYWATNALSYNPYDQKLYGWDNGHLVIYQILFKG